AHLQGARTGGVRARPGRAAQTQGPVRRTSTWSGHCTRCGATVDRFHDAVIRPVHAHARINALGARVAVINIEADAADAGVVAGKLPEVIVERAEYAIAPVSGQDINRLDPEEEAIP